MPEAVPWDVGAVIVRWDPRTLYSRIFPDPAMSPAFARLEGVVISGELGLAKPEAAIYRTACERLARALGFDVHHFTDPAALRPALEARGLL